MRDGHLIQFDRVIANPPFSQNYNRSALQRPERFPYGFAPETGKKADLMTRVTDGFGARSSVVYDTIANPAVHTRSWGHVYPQRSVTSKLWVVSEPHDDDGLQRADDITVVGEYGGGFADG